MCPYYSFCLCLGVFSFIIPGVCVFVTPCVCVCINLCVYVDVCAITIMYVRVFIDLRIYYSVYICIFFCVCLCGRIAMSILLLQAHTIIPLPTHAHEPSSETGIAPVYCSLVSLFILALLLCLSRQFFFGGKGTQSPFPLPRPLACFF